LIFNDIGLLKYKLNYYGTIYNYQFTSVFVLIHILIIIALERISLQVFKSFLSFVSHICYFLIGEK